MSGSIRGHYMGVNLAGQGEQVVSQIGGPEPKQMSGNRARCALASWHHPSTFREDIRAFETSCPYPLPYTVCNSSSLELELFQVVLFEPFPTSILCKIARFVLSDKIT